MSRHVMLHFDEILTDEERQALLTYLKRHFDMDEVARDSSQPHLLFFPTDPERAPPHSVVKTVRKWGYHARVVDL